MRQYLKLSWRNLWRNKRRTLITVASVFLAVLLAVCMRSLQKGTYANMTSNAVRFSTGYIQIHAKGYQDNRSINNSFEKGEMLDSVLTANSNVSLSVPRLESFVLASSGNHTKGVQVTGIIPELENKMNNISGRVTDGHYLTDGYDGLLVGDGIANYLGLRVGDTMVLLGQGYHGITAAAQFPVTGIFHFPDGRMNNALVYLSLHNARNLFAAPDLTTSMSLLLHDPARQQATVEQLRQALDSNQWEVLNWQTLNKELTQEIAGDNAGGIIMLFILYVVIAFGVFGTMLMMTMERSKEFAVMIAIGMRRSQLAILLFFETVFIGLLGISSGVAVALPVLLYFKINPVKITGTAAEMFIQFGLEPIMPASLDPYIFVNQGITVFLISFAASIYPLMYIGRFKILGALKK